MPANPSRTPVERRFRAYGQELAGLQWPGEGEPVLALHGWLGRNPISGLLHSDFGRRDIP